MGEEEKPENELQGVTHEDIIAAVAILREDKVIQAGKESRDAVKQLEEKYAADRAEDEKRWAKWEEANKAPLTPETDTDPRPEGVPAPPPEVKPEAPQEEGGKKRQPKKGLWFQREEEGE